MVAALGYFVDIFDLLLFAIVRRASLLDLGVPETQLVETGLWLDNILQIHSLDPASLRAHLALYRNAMTGTPTLPKVDRELIGVVVSGINGYTTDWGTTGAVCAGCWLTTRWPTPSTATGRRPGSMRGARRC